MPLHPSSTYKKPPIVEAVIALHFSVTLEEKEIDAFARKSKKSFPFSEDQIVLKTEFNLQSKKHTAAAPRKIGCKLSNADRTRLIMIQPAQFGVIQQAPYAGWDKFYEEARAHWDTLKKLISHKPVSRVSTRYINRIDIPVSVDNHIDLKRYFNVGPSLPNYAEQMALQNFYFNCSLLHPNTQFLNVLQFSTVPSPLIDHLSFTIDIDVATIETPPMQDEKLWDIIGSLREYKNDLFEACITDETRGLFL